MNNLADPNGPVMAALRKFADIVFCNVLFCLCCLPVFTAGASLTALHSSMQILASDLDVDGDTAVRTFIRTFKQDFLQSTCLEGIVAAAVLFLGLYYKVISSFDGALGSVYRITFFALCIIFLFGFQYFFPIAARFRLKTLGILKNSWLLAILSAPWTLLSIGIPAAAVYISFFMNPASFRMAVFIWAVCGFGLVTYLNSFIFLKAFEKLGVRLNQEDDPGKAAEGAIFIDESHREDEDLMVQSSTCSAPDWNKRMD